MSLDKELVTQKCKRMIADLKHIADAIAANPYEELFVDESKITELERRLERIINRAIDINFHLIRAHGLTPPDDYQSSFLLLAQNNLLSAELATALAPCVGTRNILVHEYDDVNTMQFYQALTEATKLFPQYIKEIEKLITV